MSMSKMRSGSGCPGRDASESLTLMWRSCVTNESRAWSGASAAARRESFDRADDFEQLARVFLRERRDDEALFFLPPNAGDVAFLLQAVQGAAHGCAADAQPFGDVAFDDAGARGEAARDDEVAKLFVGAGNAVAAGRALADGLVWPAGFRGLGHRGRRYRNGGNRQAWVEFSGALLYTLRYSMSSCILTATGPAPAVPPRLPVPAADRPCTSRCSTSNR